VDQAGRTRRAARSMTKAIRAMPEREQNDVLCYLLESAFASGAASAPAPEGVGHPFAAVVAEHLAPGPPGTGPSPIRMTSSFKAGAGEHRMVPLRLPEPLYDRLKAWCGEHGFAMAVVMRGLVERFLDDQAGAPRGRPAAAGRPAPRRASKPRQPVHKRG
jgi:hypothetical protein